jgi:ketosteroid isomerase-like protein
MSEENVEIARRMIEWFNALDAESAQAHSTDDIEIVPLRAAMEDTAYRGPVAFAAFRADTEDAWEEIHFDTEDLREADNRIVAIGRVSARARLTGADVIARIAILFEFRGHQLSRLRTYADAEEGLKAAGLSE